MYIPSPARWARCVFSWKVSLGINRSYNCSASYSVYFFLKCSCALKNVDCNSLLSLGSFSKPRTRILNFKSVFFHSSEHLPRLFHIPGMTKKARADWGCFPSPSAAPPRALPCCTFCSFINCMQWALQCCRSWSPLCWLNQSAACCTQTWAHLWSFPNKATFSTAGLLCVRLTVQIWLSAPWLMAARVPSQCCYNKCHIPCQGFPLWH